MFGAFGGIAIVIGGCLLVAGGVVAIVAYNRGKDRPSQTQSPPPKSGALSRISEADMNLVMIGAAIGIYEMQCSQAGILKRTASYDRSQVARSGDWIFVSLRDNNGTELGRYQFTQPRESARTDKV